MRKQTKIVALASAAALLTIGAAMTSFAEWKVEDGEWVYVDKYGDRVYNEWKKSGNDWYYLGEDGVMVTDQIVEDDDEVYYVDSAGKKVTEQWRSVDNEDEVSIGEEDVEVDTLWYYFDSKGKALKGKGGTNYKVKKLPISTGSSQEAYFLFDEEGHMMSGWVTRDYTSNGEDKHDTYYLGEENEGWAKTGWQSLEPKDDEDANGNPYEDNKWFHFSTSGKMDTGVKYIDGRYYRFDSDGVMADGWFSAPVASGSGATPDNAYSHGSGNMATGWVKTTAKDDDDGDEYWFYLVNKRDEKTKKIVATVPFNFGGTGDQAKSISGKVYVFDNQGRMKKGIYKTTGLTKDIDGAKELPAGIYYLEEDDGSTQGQMQKGRTTVEKDDEDYYYHFRNDGTAYTSGIKDGILYGADGARVQAEDGAKYRIVDVSEVANEDGEIIVYKSDEVAIPSMNKDGSPAQLAVSSSGRVKTSNSVKIDDVTYDVTYDLDTMEFKVTEHESNN